MNCSSCGEVSEGSLESIREEYKKLGFAFCESCVRSSKAYIWAEEEIERRGIRKMEKLAVRVRYEKTGISNVHQSGEYPVQCRFCGHLQEPTRPLPGEVGALRCTFGRFDVATPSGKVPQYFAWSGIWKPNKTVAAAQKDCPVFLVHPLVEFIGKRGRSV